MRLWASHLALGTEVRQVNQPPSPGAIFQQPTEAQGVAKGPFSQRENLGCDTSFLKDKLPEGKNFRQPSVVQDAANGDPSVLSAEQLQVEATARPPQQFCKGLGKESQRAKGQSFALRGRGGDPIFQQTSPIGLREDHGPVEGSSSSQDRRPPTGAIFRQPTEAQRVAKGPFAVESAMQLGTATSVSLRPQRQGHQGSNKSSQHKGHKPSLCDKTGTMGGREVSPLGLRESQSSRYQPQSRGGADNALAVWSEYPLEPTSWTAMASLCARKVLDPTWDHERDLVAMVEELEEATQEHTLASWILEKSCDATTMEDDSPETWFRILRAAEDVVLSTRRAPQPRQVKVLCANVSSWRAEHRQWLAVMNPDVALIQEVHWDAKALAKETVSLAKLGYELFSQPCPNRKQPVGGSAVMVRSHIKGASIKRYQDGNTGCGFEGVLVRFAGTNVVCVSVYLQSGQFVDGPVNAEILAELKCFLATVRCPWFIAGDWNSPLPEVLDTRLNEVFKGQFLGTGAGTAGGNNELDYALIHPALHRFVTVWQDWSVPFKPHCALNFVWQTKATRDLVPGLSVVGDDFEAIRPEQRQHVVQEAIPGQVNILEFEVSDPLSVQFAAFSATAEASGALGTIQGRGAQCSVRRMTPLSSPVKLVPWHGKEHAFWTRWESWLSANQAPPQPVMASMLEHCPDAAWKQSCQDWLEDMSNTQLQADLMQRASLAAKESRKAQSSKEKADFLEWILGAEKTSLGPVYKAIKSAEQTTLRPYRDKSLLCRAYLRMEFWAGVWDGTLLRSAIEVTASRSRLKAEAQAQAMTLPKLHWEAVKEACNKTGNKKGGVDCWSYQAVRNLTDQGYQMLTDLYHEMEAQVGLPFQMQVVQVALLPKSEAKERPISLTSVLWRIWTKLRRSYLAAWLKEYSREAGFDSAVPGHTSLDPALARLIRAEDHKGRGQTFITLFCDLEGFYDVVRHDRLAQQSLELGFPSLITELAIQLYEGPRCLHGENVASPSIWPKRGMLQGCPCAPTLAKLTTHRPLTAILAKPGVSHADLWLDDISIDIVHQDAEIAAHLGVDAFRSLKCLLHEEGLELNMSKTKFVVNNAKSRKALTTMCGRGMPEVAELVKDLGLDSAGAKRRRVTTSLKRFRICVSRQAKLKTYRLSRRQRTKVFSASPLAAGLYGHQGQGVAPKRLKVVRAAISRHAGRSQLGSTDVILDLMAHQVQDPLLKVVLDQADALFRAFVNISPQGSRILLRTWKVAWRRQSNAIHGWKTVAGPVAAMCQYCLDLGIDASDPLVWKYKNRELQIRLNSPTCSHSIRIFLSAAVGEFRAAKLGAVTTAEGAAEGVDWTIPRRLLRSPRTKKNRHAYRAVWQGQVLHKDNGGQATCRCGAARTLQHIMYECPLAKPYKLSPAATAFRRRFPQPCFWLRGMVPSSWTHLAFKAEKGQLEKTGIFVDEVPDSTGLVVGTDASGGPYTKDPRLRAVGWAVVIAERQGQEVRVVGTISGVILPPATVPQGEHLAIIEAIRHTSGILELTTDCKGALKTLHSAQPHKKTMPEWGDVWHQKERVRATWVRAHKEAEAFEAEFPQQQWRRQLNIAADHLAGLRAREALSPHAARRVYEIDRLATEINDHLASRAEWQLQGRDNQFVPRAVRETLTQFDKSQRPHAQALYANKRSRLKEMLAESSQGHKWTFTRGENATNLQLKCEVCGLWVQQTYSQAVFQRVDAHPCQGFPSQGPRFWPELHPSHTWQSTGKTWECTGCGVGFGPASAKAPGKATKVCSKDRTGTKLCFLRTSLSRTEAQPPSFGQVRPEVVAPNQATGPHLASGPGTKLVIEVASSPGQNFEVQNSGARELSESTSKSKDTKASSSKTELSSITSSHLSYEVTVPGKAKAQVPQSFGCFVGPPPEPKVPSPVGPESQASRPVASENLRPRTLAKGSRAKAKPKPDPRQTRLVFAASGSTDKHAS